jgi:hypothetical protein
MFLPAITHQLNYPLLTTTWADHLVNTKQNLFDAWITIKPENSYENVFFLSNYMVILWWVETFL